MSDTDTPETETLVETVELAPDTFWRNHCGAEMHVIMHAYGEENVLGDIWIARSRDRMFPTRYLVTPEGMQEAGYVQVDP